MSSRRTSCHIAAIVLLISSAVSGQDTLRPIEPEAVDLGRRVDFTRDVKPILEANCLACHNAGVEEGGLSLEDVAGMTKGGDRGPAVKPGDADASLLLTVASHSAEPVMPPADNDVEANDLTPRELGIIRRWIIEGAEQGATAGGSAISWRPLPTGYRSIHAAALDPEARFAAVGRGNQLEVHDLVLGGSGIPLVDPHLSALVAEGRPVYPVGAADRDLVQAVAFSPDGHLLASAGYRAVKLWKRVPAGVPDALDVPGVIALAVSEDRTKVAAASADALHVLSSSDGRRIATHPLPAAITAVTFATDGASILAACTDGVLRRWPADAGDPQHVKALPSSATAVVAVGDRIATAHDDGVIRVWSAADTVEREVKAHPGPVRRLVVLPQAPNAVISGGDDGLARIWDISSGGEIRPLAHGGTLTGIAASPDGKLIATCGAEGAVRFWNADDGSKLAEHLGRIEGLRASRAAQLEVEWRKQLVAVAEARVKESEEALKDRETIVAKATEATAAAETALAAARKIKEEAAAAARTASEQAAATPDDGSLKTKSEEAAKADGAASQKVAEAEESLRSAERSLKLAEEAVAVVKSRLAARQGERESSLEGATAAEIAAQAAKAEAERPVAATDLAFSPDSLRVAVTYSDGTVQTLAPNGRQLDSWHTADGAAHGVTFLSTEEAIERSTDGSLRRTTTTDRWEYSAALGPPEDASLDLARSTFADRVLALAFSPDGRTLATGGGEPSRGAELMLWDVGKRAAVRTFVDAHSDTVQAIEFSRDGRTIATAAADKFAKAFDVETGSFLRSFEGHTDHVLGVSFKADGATLVTSSADASVKIWDATAGEQRRTVTGHAKQVTAVRYLGLSDRIVTASGDRTVRLYRANDGGQVRAFEGPVDYIHALAVSGDGATIAAAGEEGVLFVWDAETGKLLRRIEPPQAEPPATAAR